MSEAIQLHIPEPCHENWNNMTPQEQGRFCGACQTTVVDFSQLTDKEILATISNASQHVCGRLSGSQLNRNISVPASKWRFSRAYVWNLLLATVLFTESCSEQEEVMGKIDIEEKTTAILQQQEVKGYILDSKTGAPVKGASIHMTDYGKTVLSDSTGKFSLLIEKGDSTVLEVKAPWYVTKPVLIDNKTNWQNLVIMMTEESSATMGLISIEDDSIKLKKILNK